jgi:alginate O-acetyltransferase complex protein AlgI
MLGCFKYFNFFAASFADLLGLFGVTPGWNTLNIVLPVGISFYTFQTLSYTIDIYRRSLQPTRVFSDFALFVAFFPQLVAGPIVRARDFLFQLDSKKNFQEIDYRWATMLFTVGFVKKAVVADNLAVYVDQFYASPANYDLYASWLAILAYAAQIYCDFSGYTDMAIALAGLLGYRLCGNFATPYVATDITDFWRRWHISLSTWLRDYLYISLGGNRYGKLRTYRNLMLTMLLGGLWHGASWNFVLWGGLHGLSLAIHKAWTSSETSGRRLPAIIATAMTLLTVCLFWVPFRAPDFATTLQVLQQLAGIDFATNGAPQTGSNWLLLALLVMFALHYCRHYGVFFSFWRKLPFWAYTLLLGLTYAIAVACRAPDYQPFIYFQF